MAAAQLETAVVAKSAAAPKPIPDPIAAFRARPMLVGASAAVAGILAGDGSPAGYFMAAALALACSVRIHGKRAIAVGVLVILVALLCGIRYRLIVSPAPG